MESGIYPNNTNFNSIDHSRNLSEDYGNFGGSNSVNIQANQRANNYSFV
jgi:hypothetical protein